MYYHVIVETKEREKDKFITHYELDLIDKQKIIENYAKPFLEAIDFQIDGYFVNKANIRRFQVKESNEKTDVLVDKAYRDLSSGIIMLFTREGMIEGDKYTTDITKTIFDEAGNITLKVMPSIGKTVKENRKVFIVHGRDELLKTETARFLEKLKFEVIILHEKPNEGKTIIEKIESYSDVGFGIVLYTPCDEGRIKNTGDLKARARQNVVFEHGFLIGKLGRSKVVALVKDSVETPNDISGVVYIPVDDAKAWQFLVAKELKAAGYKVELDNLV